MADGSISSNGGVLAYRHQAPNPRLREMAADQSLEGSCNCGWEGPVALELWSGAELSLPVSAAALHLRCTGCGGRSVIVTVRRAPPSPGPSAFQRWR